MNTSCTSSATQVATVEFHGHSLVTCMLHGDERFAVRPICEAIGLDWKAQHARIMRNPVLHATVVNMTMVAQDGKQREVVTLPMKMLNGFLFGLEVGRVKPELRETILTYQRECYDVLHSYWAKGVAINPRAEAAGLALTQEQVDALLGLLNKQPGSQQYLRISQQDFEEIDASLDRVMKLFHPFSGQFGELLGVKRLLRNCDPKIGCRFAGNRRVDRPTWLVCNGGVVQAAKRACHA